MPYTLKPRCRSLPDIFTNFDLAANLGGLLLMLSSEETGHNPQQYTAALIAVTGLSLVRDIDLMLRNINDLRSKDRLDKLKMFLTVCKASAAVPTMVTSIIPQKAAGVTAGLLVAGVLKDFLGMLKSTAPALGSALGDGDDADDADDADDGPQHGTITTTGQRYSRF